MSGNPIILFDGVCHLCSGFVQAIIKRDTSARFRFAALQSTSGRRLLAEHGLSPEHIHTVVLIDGAEFWMKSGAALRIARRMDGLWPVFGLLLLVPRPLRDWGYDFIAARRYRWFGKRESCMVPSPDVRIRFLE